MRQAIAGLLVLASCSSLRDGTDHYHEGMAALPRDPDLALRHFARAESRLSKAVKEDELRTADLVTATANRVRSLIELGRHEDAASLLAARIQGFAPDRRYEGDLVGLALVKAGHLDSERGYAQLVLAERFAGTERSRLHLAWQQARFLRSLGTPKSRAEAVRLCDAHAGALDFDAMKKALAAP